MSITPLDIVLNKTKDYLATPSVVGYEQVFIKKLKADFGALNLSVTAYDGLLCIEGKEPLSATLSAHIDRHGLVANGKGELEYAAYRVKENKYAISREIKKTMWQKIQDRFEGEEVYAYHPISGNKLISGRITSSYLCPVRENFVFNVEKLENLEANTPVSFSEKCPLGKEQITGQLDNVLSVAVCYALYKNGFQGRLLLTTEEEIGKSWQHILNYYKQTTQGSQKLLVLDTSPFSKEDEIDFTSVVLRNKDSNGDFNSLFTQNIKQKCKYLNIPYIVKDEFLSKKSSKNLGSTELGRLIAESKGQLNGTTIQIPTLGYHSNHEKSSFKAIANFYNLLNHINA